MKRAFSVFLSALPFLIVLALLYAAFYIKPSVDGTPVPPPPMARNDVVYGVTAPDGDALLWAAGSDGKVWTSRDHARTWTVQRTPTRQLLQDIAAWDAQRAVAVGNDGVVLVTADGGHRWTKVDVPRSPIANKLVRVRTYPGGAAWAVGEAGVALRSRDYGLHWDRVTPDEDSGWNDVAKLGDRVILAGEFGRLRVSADDGATWRDVNGPVKSSLMAIAFRDDAHGVAVGLDGVVLRTDDGGATWERPQSATTTHLFDVTWDGGRWAAVGNNGILLTGDAAARDWRTTSVSATDRRWHTRIVALQDGYLWAGQGVGPIARPPL